MCMLAENGQISYSGSFLACVFIVLESPVLKFPLNLFQVSFLEILGRRDL